MLVVGAVLRAEAPPDSALFANDGRGFVDRMPELDGLPGWLSAAELDRYVEEFRRTGFTGGLNWYRNMDRNWETTAELASHRVDAVAVRGRRPRSGPAHVAARRRSSRS